jgi:NADH-quinone oxidoreductase subunit G
VRTSLPTGTDIASMLGNATDVVIAKPGARARGLERVADIPIHFADRSSAARPPQQTADAKPPRARMNALTLAEIGVAECR